MISITGKAGRSALHEPLLLFLPPSLLLIDKVMIACEQLRKGSAEADEPVFKRNLRFLTVYLGETINFTKRIKIFYC
jgi:hypothetical protein